jgi:hypothetical protein
MAMNLRLSVNKIFVLETAEQFYDMEAIILVLLYTMLLLLCRVVRYIARCMLVCDDPNIYLHVFTFVYIYVYYILL